MKACYYWSHKLNLLTSFHTPGAHVVTSGQCPMSWWPHIETPMPPLWSPDSVLPRLWWLLVTAESSVSYSGLVKSLVINPHRKHHSHGPVTVSIIAHLPHRTLFCFTFLLIWREDHDYIDNIAEPASCEPGPSHWPCLHVTGEKLGSSDYWDPEWGVQTVCRPKNVVRHVSVPHPDTASTGDHWPWGAPCHTPDLSWCDIPQTHHTQDFCIVRYLVST